MWIRLLALAYLFAGPAFADEPRALRIALDDYMATASWEGGPELACEGSMRQGGFAVCRLDTFEPYRIEVDGAPFQYLGAEGALGETDAVFIAFDRDHVGDVVVYAQGLKASAMPLVPPVKLTVADSEWDIQRITSLPPAKVTPRTPEQQKKVEEDWVKKQEAWKSRAPQSFWFTGFIRPVGEARITGVFGSERILNDDRSGRVHRGIDYAAPTGTPVMAPAGGVITIADPDLYFEGGTIAIDHGQGIQSVMMHLSRLDVEVGQVVEQGEVIGAIGSTGRSTGPHLHWGVRVAKARLGYLNASEGIYIDPAQLLEFLPVKSEG